MPRVPRCGTRISGKSRGNHSSRPRRRTVPFHFQHPRRMFIYLCSLTAYLRGRKTPCATTRHSILSRPRGLRVRLRAGHWSHRDVADVPLEGLFPRGIMTSTCRSRPPPKHMLFPGGTTTLVPCPDGMPDAVEDVHALSLNDGVEKSTLFVPELLCMARIRPWHTIPAGVPSTAPV